MAGDKPDERAARAGTPIRWRIALGAALVTIAAGGVVFAHRASQQPPSTRYLVVTEAVAAGQPIETTDLGAVAIDLPGAVDALTEDRAADVVGRVAAHGLEESRLLAASDIVEDGAFESPDEVVTAISVDAQRIPVGSFEAGDIIQLFSTSETGTIALTEARVVRMDDDESGGLGGGSLTRLLLSVANREVSASVIDAAVNDTLTVAVPSPNSPKSP